MINDLNIIVLGLQGLSTEVAAVAAVAAWRAASTSKRQADIAEATRLELSSPTVILEARYYKHHAAILVRNVGHGVARDIRFSSNAKSLPSMLNNYDFLQSEVFKQGIPYLAPGQEWSTDWTSLVGLADVWRERWGEEGIEIQIEYRSIDLRHEYVGFATINPIIGLSAMDIDTPEMKRRAAFEKALPDLLRYLKQKEFVAQYWASKNKRWLLKPVDKVRKLTQKRN